MLNTIQQFVLGLLKASSKQIKELCYFALAVGLRFPSLFIVFYFVFVYGMEDKIFRFGSLTVNVKEVHILIVLGFASFMFIYISKLLKTKFKAKDYGTGQIMVRFLHKIRYILIFGGIVNLLMLKFTLTKINTYIGIVLICFLVSFWFEAKYYDSSKIEWSD
jgi:hypothetical protein